MTSEITRIVTKKGVAIEDRLYIAPELAALIGHRVTVALPEGPLPQTLSAVCGTQSLTIHDSRALLARIDVAALAAHTRRRCKNHGFCTCEPFRKPTSLD